MPPTHTSLEGLFAAPQRLLRERLQQLLAPLDQRLRSDVVRALEEPGKLLWRSEAPAERPAGVWALLTLLVAQYLSPEVDQALASTVGVGVECYICALDLLDDVEDGDQTPVTRELGVARTLSVATTLLFLTQHALLAASAYVPHAQVVRLLGALSESSLKATVGQHLDILSVGRSALQMTVQDSLGVLAAKSGTLMSLACRLGALCAGVPEQAHREWALLGALLGLAHQLDNDAHDRYDGVAVDALARGGVGERAVKTYPVVLAAHIYAKQRAQRRPAPGRAQTDQALWQVALQEALVDAGCMAALYRDQVRAYLEQLDAQRPLLPALRFLLLG